MKGKCNRCNKEKDLISIHQEYVCKDCIWNALVAQENPVDMSLTEMYHNLKENLQNIGLYKVCLCLTLIIFMGIIAVKFDILKTVFSLLDPWAPLP